MLHVSQFQPDTSRSAEWLAVLWQGAVPASLVIRTWLYLDEEPRRMVFLWDGDEEAEAWVEDRFREFGALSTERVRNATLGMTHAMHRDLVALREVMAATGAYTDDELDAELELRRRGKEATDREAAAAIGRTWAHGDRRAPGTPPPRRGA